MSDFSPVALLWQGNEPKDLNQFVRPGSNFAHLDFTAAINDSGEIAGTGTTSAGKVHAFLAIPAAGGALDFSPSEPIEAARPARVPHNLRRMMSPRIGR